MPGTKGRSGGHNAKPTATHRLQGTFRKDRHGDRGDEVIVSDKPQMPTDLPEYAQGVWRDVVDATPSGVYAVQDGELLRAYCIACGKAREAEDSDNVQLWHKAVQVMTTLASKLGVGPIDRTRLELPPTPAEDPLKEFQNLEYLRPHKNKKHG